MKFMNLNWGLNNFSVKLILTVMSAALINIESLLPFTKNLPVRACFIRPIIEYLIPYAILKNTVLEKKNECYIFSTPLLRF